jgi:tetratricopeptide (TPR) repeat protein
MKIGRNDPCPCGSGKKYKKCCEAVREVGSFNQAATLQTGNGNIHQALEHHRAGNLSDAEAIYQNILRRDPHHVDALNLLGMLETQTGEFEAAEQHINQAIAKSPRNEQLHNNLGTVFKAQGKLKDSIRSFKKAVELNPQFADAYHNLADVYDEQGETEEAIKYYRKAISLNPKLTEAYNNLGVTLEDHGKIEEAIECFKKALQLRPDYADALNNLGTAYKNNGDLKRAVECFEKAIELMPGSAVLFRNLASVLHDLGRYNDAVGLCKKALEIDPEYSEAYNDLGVFLNDYSTIGEPHEGVRKLDEAILSFREAIKLNPTSIEAHSNLAGLLIDAGNIDEAATSVEVALRLDPESAQARFNQSLIMLLKGDLEQGLKEYEWRWKLGRYPYQNGLLWNGDDIQGKTILLVPEQGLGDTIQFVRYTSFLKAAGATTIVKCQPSLFRLLKTCQGIDHVVAEDKDLPHFDTTAPLMSLPYLMKTTLNNIPSNVPYLSPSFDMVGKWKAKLGITNGYKVGISWQGSPEHRNDKNRSIHLSYFKLMADIEGVKLVSLQKGHGADQLRENPGVVEILELEDMRHENWDFMDSAAVIKNLDLVITVDSAVAHLAGALGVPVWVLIPYGPDWRWMLEREDSPWYPTMRLFRQNELGNWTDVLVKVCESLRANVIK